MSTDPGSDLTPERLLWRRGEWLLELTRWVALDRQLLRPERVRLRGADAIVTFLVENGERALSRATERTVRSHTGQADMVFELANDAWQPRTRLSEEPDRVSSQTVASLQNQLLVLRALHEGLRGRVAELEARLAGAPLADRPPTVPPVPAGFEVAALPAARRPSAEPVAPAAPPGPAEAEVQAGPAPRPAAAWGAPPPPAVLTLPTGRDVRACLTTLLGEDPGLRDRPAPWPDGTALLECRLIDDDGVPRGEIVLDARAVAELGGRLIGLPEPVIEQHAREGLSDEISEPAAEVCNNLSGIVNRASVGCHVRSGPLRQRREDARLVVKERLELGLANGGRFALVSGSLA